jgi:hypothetical protein
VESQKQLFMSFSAFHFSETFSFWRYIKLAAKSSPEPEKTEPNALFVWIISHQTAVLFSQNKPAISNRSAVLFSQNKLAPAISHQPNEQAVNLHFLPT